MSKQKKDSNVSSLNLSLFSVWYLVVLFLLWFLSKILLIPSHYVCSVVVTLKLFFFCDSYLRYYKFPPSMFVQLWWQWSSPSYIVIIITKILLILFPSISSAVVTMKLFFPFLWFLLIHITIWQGKKKLQCFFSKSLSLFFMLIWVSLLWQYVTKILIFLSMLS